MKDLDPGRPVKTGEERIPGTGRWEMECSDWDVQCCVLNCLVPNYSVCKNNKGDYLNENIVTNRLSPGLYRNICLQCFLPFYDRTGLRYF